MSWLSGLNLSSYLDIHQCPGVMKENINYELFAKAVGMSAHDIEHGVTVSNEVCVCLCVCVFVCVRCGGEVEGGRGGS